MMVMIVTTIAGIAIGGFDDIMDDDNLWTKKMRVMIMLWMTISRRRII